MAQETATKSFTRHGEFLSNHSLDTGPLLARVKVVIDDALRSDRSPEDREILKELSGLVTQSEVSNYIKEAGHSGKFRISHQEFSWLANHPEKNWCDYLIYRYKFKVYPYQRKLTDFPVHLMLEPTSVCNLRCVMCFQSDETFNKKEFMGIMPWDLFKKVVDEARAHGCQAVTLASRGEPSLNKEFGKMLRYLGEVGFLDIKINTNATKLTEALCRDILEAGVSEMVFSVDAATKKTYEEIRRRGKFEEVVANVEMFNRIRAEYPGSPTMTRISGVYFREDQDPDQMKSFWSERVDQVVVKQAIPRWDSYALPANDIKEPCHLLWERMYVWYDGTCNPCDFDYKSDLAVGNAKTHTLAEIWKSEAFASIRNAHSGGERGTVKPCDRCPLH